MLGCGPTGPSILQTSPRVHALSAMCVAWILLQSLACHNRLVSTYSSHSSFPNLHFSKLLPFTTISPCSSNTYNGSGFLIELIRFYGVCFPPYSVCLLAAHHSQLLNRYALLSSYAEEGIEQQRRGVCLDLHFSNLH
ncbi:hypothetical protein HJG60_010111 [Phyllostomus discolor]|uniref:Uncharacterized protein n=1 Tax=Phyllostomus discolor TaxID=89673 RepID=A0A834AZC4_9CHIR|nr:hypothetical protein HJG60_010111 [Phyllostomus discolor]